MLPVCRPNLADIKPYKPGKPIEEVARELKLRGEIIKLASNENPVGPSPKAKAAMRGVLNEMQLYPDDSCCYLKQRLAEKLAVDEDWILMGNGSVELILNAALAYLSPNESAVFSDGAFIIYKIATQIAGGRMISTPMKGYTHDLEAMGAAITPGTRVVFIANPNNPTGTIVRKDEFDRFMARVPEHVLVVMDEAYREYIDDPAYPDSFGHLRAGRNIMILRTFSKIYGLAGIRVGYGIARPELVQDIGKMRMPFNVSRIGQAAALAALDDEAHVRHSVRVNNAGKEYLYDTFKRMGLEYIPTYANFIFVDFGRDALDLFDKLQRRRVIARPIREYGFPNALRISIGTELQNERLVRSLKAALK